VEVTNPIRVQRRFRVDNDTSAKRLARAKRFPLFHQPRNAIFGERSIKSTKNGLKVGH
jgi:hypothetical protein